MKDTISLVNIAVLSRIVVFVLCSCSRVVLEPHDVSGDSKVFGMAHWDGVHYLSIAKFGYEGRARGAFFPMYPLLVRTLSSLLWFIPSTDLRLEITAIAVSNVSFVTSVLLLHKLTLKVFRSKRMAWTSAVFFCFHPASIFLSSAYTESLFCSLTFFALVLLEHDRTFMSICIFSLASWTRPNGILHIGFILHRILHRKLNPTVKLFRQSESVFALVSGAMLICGPFYIFQEYIGGLFGGDGYMGIQRDGWNVGFLQFYKIEQIPNFVRALPAILIASWNALCFFQSNPDQLRSLGMYNSPQTQSIQNQTVYTFHMMSLLFISLLFLNVNITTRFLTSSPAFSWAISNTFNSPSTKHLVLIWIILYITIGSILFSLSYPWT